MPKVPTYDNFTVNPQANPDVRIQAPEFINYAAQQEANTGKALSAVGQGMSSVAADMQNVANKVRVDDATNKAKELALSLQYAKPSTNPDGTPNEGGFLNVTGEAALNRASKMPLADEYKQKFDDKIQEIANGLGNDAQKRAFLLQANNMAASLYGSATAHEAQQFTKYQLSVNEGTVKTASAAILSNPLDKANVDDNTNKIKDAIFASGKLAGKSAEEISALQSEGISQTHLNSIKALLTPDENGNTNMAGAEAYFKTYKDQLQGLNLADASKLVGAANDARQTLSGADAIWSSMAPKGYNSPVDIFKMEQQVRDQYGQSNPKLAKSIIDELRSRKAAFDSSQSEFNAANLDAVGRLAASGASLTTIQASPSFQALPGNSQETVISHLKSMASANEVATQLATGPAYLKYSDPTVLSKMSRNEVIALWPVLGKTQTEALTSKWDTLQNKDALLTAHMDNDQFKGLADQFGYSPYASSQSEDQKRELGTLKQRVDDVLEQSAKQKGQPLTRDEKEKLMRSEMARTVTVKNTLWFNSTKPLIALTPDELKNVDMGSVTVPESERKLITQALNAKFAETKNPAYQPTETNIRMLYVQRHAPASRALNAQ